MTTSDGSIQGVTKIIDHGPDASRWNFVILGDGYQSAELPTYENDAANFASTLSTTAPFDQLWPAINVHRVDVASTDSGAADPVACGGTGATPHTYFDATFCGDGKIQRLLTVNTATATSVASSQVPSVNMTFVIVNSATYGGSGGPVAVFSKAADAQEIGLHEMGHTAFGFADEYEYFAGCASGETGHDSYTGAEPAEPNVTTVTDRATIKWASLIAAATVLPTTSNADCAQCDPQASPVPAGTVGAFEGARYFHCGIYRPEYNCRMRVLGNPFCHVCSSVISAKITPYMPAPAITGVSPTSGSAAGGDTVTITGSGFTGATDVSIGPASAAAMSVDSDTQITATTPPGSGTVDITVTTAAGTSATSPADQFTYAAAAAAPAITGVSPTSGSAAGGDTVTITGSGFTGATDVSIGPASAAAMSVDSDTQITATTPPGSGTVDITVTTAAGTSATSPADQFTYAAAAAAPAITGVSPTSGSAAGGDTVTITGSGFTGATDVSIGPASAAAMSVDSDTQITATTPPGSGTVDITVTTAAGTSATSPADQFTYS